MTPSIRPAAERDFPELVPLFEELDALHREAVPHVFKPPGGPARSQEELRKMSSDTGVLLLAEQGGLVVGVANAYILDTAEEFVFRARRSVVIDNVAVATQSRRQGVATQLVRELERWAASRDADAVELNVWSFNESAAAFYRSLGYTTVRERLAKDCARR
jgi:ribosomal protein S18 acetylase RimI-like enzyme